MDRVLTDEGGVSPAAGEVLYVLSFEGKNELAAPVALPLVDSAGKERRPVAAGSPAKSGALSHHQWKYTGELTAKDGQWTFEGQVQLPEPKVALVYSVPAGSAWFLKDGERKHRVL